MSRTMTASERLYRLRKAEPASRLAPPKDDKPAPVPPIKHSRADVDEILNHRRSATLDEIEWLLAHADDVRFQLTTADEFHLRSLAARLLADLHIRTVRGRFDDEEFAAKTLGVIRTRYGDLSRDEIEQIDSIRLQAMNNIERCGDHKREKCACWRDARVALFEIRRRVGERSPLGIAALACWNSIEELALLKQKQEPTVEPQRLLSPQQQLEMTGTAINPFNWRYWKSPTYPGFAARA